MTIDAGPELHLSLTAAGTVLAETDPQSVGLLRGLQLDFPTADSFGRSAFEVDLGSFLGSIASLSRWRGGNVHWSPQLQGVAERSLDDGDHFQSLRAGRAEQVEHPEVESDWQGNLTSFQERDLKLLLQMRHGANFSVPGAGKTRVALAAFSNLRKLGAVERVVVVAPKSAHESWIVETAASFADGREVTIYQGGQVPDSDIVLINYERLISAQRYLASVLSRHDVLLVLDEAHRMKRGQSGAYGSACLALGPLAKARLVLSGTPAPNGLADLKSLMEFAWPGNGSRVLGTGTSPDTVSDTLRPLFTRTTKDELDLPPLEVVTSTVSLPPIHREIYDALLGQLRGSVADAERVDDLGRVIVYLLMAATSPSLLALGSSKYEPLQFRVPTYRPPHTGVLRSLLADLPQYEMSPKLLEAVRIARENAERGRKTIIWSTFIRNLTTVQSMLPELGPQVVVGSTSDEDRRAAIQRFRQDQGAFVLLSNPSTLGEGVSLHQECHDAVYVDRDFAAGRFLQSIDRIHRLGLDKNESTKATVLIADNTIDNLVNARLSTKITWMTNVLDDESLAVLADLEEERETGPVLDASDAAAVWAYLGNPA